MSRHKLQVCMFYKVRYELWMLLQALVVILRGVQRAAHGTHGRFPAAKGKLRSAWFQLGDLSITRWVIG